MELNLKGKNALVLGSSSGIGLAIASTLAAEGANVLLASRSLEKLQVASAESKAKGYFACDLSQPEEGRELAGKAEEFFRVQGLNQNLNQNLNSGTDILIINTGGPAKGLFADVSSSQWTTDFHSLWLTPIEILKVILPGMAARGYGRVLFVTSVAARKPLAGLTTSNGLRAGLEGLVRSLVMEYSAQGITFNLLLPGYTKTERLMALNLGPEQVKKLIPRGVLAEPSELASLATFLCSPHAQSTTGQSIAIDGGVSSL
jgi:3-oxoacyl-[acyl-carrier protein] reductase